MDFLQIFLNKRDTKPLYYQLYIFLVDEISTGKLYAGQRLPGKRTAAEQLGISVNTVDEAYQMLAAEGYVTALPRSGFVVNRLEQLVPSPRGRAPQPVPPQKSTRIAYSFATGDIDTALFPRKMWNRLLREVMMGGDDLFARGNGMGDAALREAIAHYLQSYRGVHCTAGQIAVGAGLEVLVGMLARLYPHHTVAVESPGYAKNIHIFQNMGNTVRPLEVDEEGMCPRALRQSKAMVAYLTPSHQFPTGAVMPVGRRTEILRLAGEKDLLIVEDDYDSEFRFDGRPLPSLQGLDKDGRVVYAGTFSRSLAPGFRAAYLVLPNTVLQKWQAAYGDYACTMSRPEQQTLARFMDEGHFARSLNRMRGVYKKRRGHLLAALEAALPPYRYRVLNSHTGLYLILELPGTDAPALAARARQEGLQLRAINEYRPSGTPPATHTAERLVLGYGGLADTNIEKAVAMLAGLITG